MDIVTPRYVIDEHQTPTDVVLTIEQWREILAELEELDDIRAYDEARSVPQESVPLDRAAQDIRAGRST